MSVCFMWSLNVHRVKNSINKNWRNNLVLYSLFLLFPFLTFGQLTSIHSVNHPKPNKDTSLFAFSDVQVKPEFPGGENELYKFLEETIFLSSSIQEQVGSRELLSVLTFVVDKNGNISNIWVQQSSDVQIEQQIQQAIQKMPKWTPGKMGDKPVNSRMYLPIKYVVENNKLKITNSGKELTLGNRKETNILKYSIIGVCLALFYLVAIRH